MQNLRPLPERLSQHLSFNKITKFAYMVKFEQSIVNHAWKPRTDLPQIPRNNVIITPGGPHPRTRPSVALVYSQALSHQNNC